LLKFNAIRFENVRIWEKPSDYALKTLVFEKKPPLYALKTLNFKLTLPSLVRKFSVQSAETACWDLKTGWRYLVQEIVGNAAPNTDDDTR
jgi:hypothetical protein